MLYYIILLSIYCTILLLIYYIILYLYPYVILLRIYIYYFIFAYLYYLFTIYFVFDLFLINFLDNYEIFTYKGNLKESNSLIKTKEIEILKKKHTELLILYFDKTIKPYQIVELLKIEELLPKNIFIENYDLIEIEANAQKKESLFELHGKKILIAAGFIAILCLYYIYNYNNDDEDNYKYLQLNYYRLIKYNSILYLR